MSCECLAACRRQTTGKELSASHLGFFRVVIRTEPDHLKEDRLTVPVGLLCRDSPDY